MLMLSRAGASVTPTHLINQVAVTIQQNREETIRVGLVDSDVRHLILYGLASVTQYIRDISCQNLLKPDVNGYILVRVANISNQAAT